MNISAIREFVNTHPEGILIRMVDGTKYEIPHRDFVWFTPYSGDPASRFATSFYVAYEGVGRLVNALLVAEVTPLARNGHDGKQPDTGTNGHG